MLNLNKKQPKVIVGMSGGVDSSVAAALLKNQGYQVVGVFMHFWHDVADGSGSIDSRIENICCSRESEESARKTAQKLGIKFYSMNVSKEFKKAVVDYFLREYNAGRTPNPCIECNRQIKFGVMIDKAIAMGADYVATGHYARLRREFPISNFQFPKIKLLKAKDTNKDQTYFLYTLTQKKLRHCLFPIGDYEKSEVREIAKKHGLEVYNKSESQEICFIAGRRYGDFLRKYLKLTPGNIIDKGGNILGVHGGLPLYTIGQRKDIGIGGTGPYYVVKMDRKKNELVVSSDKNDKNLFSNRAILEKVNWIAGTVSKLPLKIKAKIRYRMDECFAVVRRSKKKYVVEFLKPQRAAMPGQSVVFYKREEMLGGGIIEKTEHWIRERVG